jgi:cytochrome c peroxidase
MARRCCCCLFIFGVLMLASCQRAQRFPATAKPSPGSEPKGEDADKDLYRFSWVEAVETRDLPILFVPDTSPEWRDLKDYWNALPFPAGMPTAHLGLAPMQALAALVFTEHHAAVKIKVPLGLPDPTEFSPKSNPPTFGKWRLGKAIFHESLLQADGGPYSCATCHKPEEGFAERRKLSREGKYNTLSLINVAYNRRQFWDGRVESLEETVVRSLADERADDPQRSDKALRRHNWGGFVRALVASKRYNDAFKRVFGVDEHPTQDSVGKALACYMRTVLSGDSLYDRANQIRKEKGAQALTTEHFLALFGKKDQTGNSLAVLHDDPGKELTQVELKTIARGYELFKGTARCGQCHPGPLFTDHDYHNVGYAGDEGLPDPGVETGRSAHVPIGHKEWRLLGAFRTPTLRNLANTGPYLHKGEEYTLENVVDFFDNRVLPTKHLAAALRDGDDPRRLKLEVDEKNALVMFLRALEGTPVDAIVTRADR